MKRLTETDKWKDEWFGSLKPLEKLTFNYITDNCDNAGFFEINARLNSFIIGISEQEYLGAIKGLARGLIFSSDERKIWLKNFLEHQKNLPLNPENNYHKQIINLIKSNQQNFNYDFNYLGAKQGLFSPLVISNSLGNGLGLGDGGSGEVETPFIRTHGKSISDFEKELLTSERAKQERCVLHKLTPEKHDEFVLKFILKIKVEEHWQDRREALRYFSNTIPYFKKEEVNQAKSLKPVGTPVEKGNRPTFEAAA